MLDQYAAFLNDEGLDSLGDWMHQQDTTTIPKKWCAALRAIRTSGLPETDLRREWHAQKLAQSSLRSRRSTSNHDSRTGH